MKKSVICNVILAVLELIGIILSLIGYGIAQYKYFTEDINLFSCILSIIYCIYGIREIKGRAKMPKAFYILRNITAINLVMVFCTCLAGGITGYNGHTFCHIMFADCSLFFHTLCPVMSAVMALFIEKPGITSMRKGLLALVPPIIYSTVIIPLNILRIVHGPYTYLFVYEVPVSTVVGAVAGIYILTLIITGLFVFIRKKTCRKDA